MANANDEDETPEIPHERLYARGKPGSVLLGKIVEVRGLRSVSSNHYAEPWGHLGALDASRDANDPGSVFDWMNSQADRVLKNAGEKTRDEVVATVQNALPPGTPEANEAFKLAFALNLVDVTARHGLLSRATTAARWLLMSDTITHTLNLFADEDVRDNLLHWADAWYWLRFEESAAHYLAFTGLKSLEGRKTGPEAKAKVKSEKEAIIREEFAKLDARDQWKLETAAFQLMAPLARRFAEAKQPPYALGTLKKEITRLKLVKEAKKRQSSA